MRTIIVALLLLAVASPAAAQDRTAAQRAVIDMMRGRTDPAPAATATPSGEILLPWTEAAAVAELARGLQSLGATAELRGDNRLVATDSTGSATFAVHREAGRMTLRLVAQTGSVGRTVEKIVLAERRRSRGG